MAVADELTRRRSRAFALGEGLLPVYDDRPIAVRALHPAPFAAREIVRDLADPVGIDIEALQIVHDDVGMGAFAQRAAILEAGRMRGQRRQAIVRLLESDLLLVADQPAEEVGREGAAGEELGMRAAVGNARESVRRVVDD